MYMRAVFGPVILRDHAALHMQVSASDMYPHAAAPADAACSLQRGGGGGGAVLEMSQVASHVAVHGHKISWLWQDHVF